MRLLFVLLLLIAAGASASAADLTRSQRIQRLMEAQGLLQMLEGQLAQGREMAVKASEQMKAQVLSAIDQADDQAKAKFEAAMDRFLTRTQNSLTAEDMVAQWASLYGRNLTDQDLDHIFDYYSSPIGQKDARASQAALGPYMQWCVQVQQQKMSEAATAFFEEIKVIAKR